MTSRIRAYLSNNFKSAQRPRILKLLKETDSDGNPASFDDATVHNLHSQIRETDDRFSVLVNKHRQLQSDYHNLITIASELVQALTAVLNGEQVRCPSTGKFNKPPTKSPTQFSQITPVYLYNICQRLAGFRRSGSFQLPYTHPTPPSPRFAAVPAYNYNGNATSPRPQSQSPYLGLTQSASPMQRGAPSPMYQSQLPPVPPKSQQQQQQQQTLKKLDLGTIRKDLISHPNDRRRCLLAHALRTRVVRAFPTQRRGFVIEYKDHDVLGMRSDKVITALSICTGGPFLTPLFHL